MRMLAPRPLLLALTLVLVIGAIALIELRLGAPGTAEAQANARPSENQPKDESQHAEKTVAPAADKQREKTTTNSSSAAGESGSAGSAAKKPAVSDAERIAHKKNEYPRAKEIVNPTGLINTDGVSIKDAVGEKVILLEFWTYSCYNCQNAQPHINALNKKYKDDGLQVIGVHTPEFGFEKDISNVREAVRQANIQYPVVLDSNYATWNAYNQRFWPAWYLIDADGFIRYKHFGEGAYGETEQKIQDLLAEKDRISN